MTEPALIAAARITWEWRGAMLAGIADMGLEASSRVRMTGQAVPPDVAEVLGVADAVALVTMIYAARIPVQVAASWVVPGREPAAITELVTVRRATRKEVEALRIDHDHPVFSIRRETADSAGNVIEVTLLAMPVYAFRLSYAGRAE